MRAEAQPPPHQPGLALTWHGHSTVLVELDGARILTDPLLRSRVAHLVRRESAAAPDVERTDIVLVSHAHRDHLDYPSLRLVPRGAVVVVPRGLGSPVSRLGFHEVIEVVEGETVDLRGIHLHAVHADHEPGRGIVPGGAVPVGFVVAGSRCVYFAGDTDLFAGMAHLGPIDVALLPVSGWGPTTPAGHLDPGRAVEALQLLRPRAAVPIHWGTFRPFYRRQAYESDTVAPSRFAALARELVPDVEVRVLALGDRWAVASSDADDARPGEGGEAPAT